MPLAISTMSKTKLNGVDPQDMIEKYGADTARFYVMQANPPPELRVVTLESMIDITQRLDKLQILLEEQLPRNPQRLGVRDANPFLVLRLDARLHADEA